MINIKLDKELFRKHSAHMNKKIVNKIDSLLKSRKWYLEKDTLPVLLFIKKNINNILESNHTNMVHIAIVLQNIFPTLLYKKSNTFETVSDIFVGEYENWRNRTTPFENAYFFVQKLKINTCPYCNRNYTSVITKDTDIDKKTRPELDHFLPKALYPYFAVSYYNLIPSCKTCNHLKSDDDSSFMINPYDISEKNDDFVFSYKLLDEDEDEDEDEDSELFASNNIKIVFKEKISDNEKCFALEKIYHEHRDIVSELLLMKETFSDTLIDELASYNFSKKEIYRFLFRNYFDDDLLSKRPLSKLTKDIVQGLNFNFLKDDDDLQLSPTL